MSGGARQQVCAPHRAPLCLLRPLVCARASGKLASWRAKRPAQQQRQKRVAERRAPAASARPPARTHEPANMRRRGLGRAPHEWRRCATRGAGSRAGRQSINGPVCLSRAHCRPTRSAWPRAPLCPPLGVWPIQLACCSRAKVAPARVTPAGRPDDGPQPDKAKAKWRRPSAGVSGRRQDGRSPGGPAAHFRRSPSLTWPKLKASLGVSLWSWLDFVLVVGRLANAHRHRRRNTHSHTS